VRVSVRREDGRAVCAVRDWGVGIPRKEQARIFERFHRVGSGLVHDVKGSGLGLAIAEHVARAHGGDLVVESEPGEGTRISFRIPVEGADQGAGIGSPRDARR
jgi:signal transduction histidine kinase